MTHQHSPLQSALLELEIISLYLTIDETPNTSTTLLRKYYPNFTRSTASSEGTKSDTDTIVSVVPKRCSSLNYFVVVRHSV